MTQPCLSTKTDEELLTAFLPACSVQELMTEYGTVPQALLSTYPEELTRIRGIGPMKARQLQYVCELVKRLYVSAANLPPIIRCPSDVVTRLADMKYCNQEEFRALYVNTKNRVLAERTISRGTINATLVTPREVFHAAVKLMAAGVILVHNHPSGDPEPSQDDILVTQRLQTAGKIMDIPILDHIIISKGGYVSLKERRVAVS